MNWNKLNRKVRWVLYAGIALLLISQQHALQVSRANERSADVQIARFALENSALRLAAKRNAQLNELLIPQLLWGGK